MKAAAASQMFDNILAVGSETPTATAVKIPPIPQPMDA
jgi:hypothetical protein